VSLPFDRDRGLIIVPAHLWGPSGDTILHLALDTGATGSLVNWEAMLLIGYDPAVTQQRLRVTTGSGVAFAPRIPVERIEALGQERRDFPLLCHTLPPSASVDGVLGLDFLRGKRLTIDFRTGSVTLE
jgi:predicted aspartyl protease